MVTVSRSMTSPSAGNPNDTPDTTIFMGTMPLSRRGNLSPFLVGGHGHELVAGVVELPVRVLTSLKIRRFEDLLHIKSVVAQNFSFGLVWKFGDWGANSFSSPDCGSKLRN
ncbi:hypothetical protein TNCV_1536651 [Trichonephila clavipes]|nr:hypothetical protein TNCV_1536651 [Trichonephila clavipes]